MLFSKSFPATVVFLALLAPSYAEQDSCTWPTATRTASLTPAQASAAACLESCNPKDAYCRGKCVAVAIGPNPLVPCEDLCMAKTGTQDLPAYFDCVDTCVKAAILSLPVQTSTASSTSTSPTTPPGAMTPPATITGGNVPETTTWTTMTTPLIPGAPSNATNATTLQPGTTSRPTTSTTITATTPTPSSDARNLKIHGAMAGLLALLTAALML